MRIIFICSLLLTMVLSLCGQTNNKRDDYLVLNNNDTLRGKVFTFGSYNSKNIWVRIKNINGKQRFRMSEVKSFKFKGRYFDRHRYQHLKWQVEGYLQVLLRGKISLLYSYCNTARLKFDLYVLLASGEVVPVTAHNYYTILLPIFQQSAEFREKTGGVAPVYPRYNKRYLPTITQFVNWYNEGEASPY